MGQINSSTSIDVASSQGSARSLLDQLARHATQRPDAQAYVFLNNGLAGESRTFRQLAERASAIAALLREQAATGERALLWFRPGLDFVDAILGCFSAGTVAVPIQPLRHVRELPRLDAIAKDAKASFVLTHRAALTTALKLGADKLLGAGVRWLCVDELPGQPARPQPLLERAGLQDISLQSTGLQGAGLDPSALAFLQYTSGSTGSPKGVMVTHANLLHNQRSIQVAFRHDESTIFAGWLPFYHDMGLIGNVFQPLFLGIKSVLFAPTAFLTSPLSWLKAISTWRATTSGAPSFAYELCVARFDAHEMQGVDLSSWKVAFNGAEPVRADVIEAFSRCYAPYGFREEAFYPCYGMAEATLFVTGGEPGTPLVKLSGDSTRDPSNESDQHVTAAVLIGCGQAHGGQRTCIVDPVSRMPLPDGKIGEIWIAGESVAAGYWQRPDATEEIFGARTSSGDGPFLRSGDLGFIQHGSLFITGRLKDVIIIYGRNHYPTDLELTVYQSDVGLRAGCVAVFTIDGGDGTRLVAVAEVERSLLSRSSNPSMERLRMRARQAVADTHGLTLSDLVLIRTGTLAKTSSGKIRRSTIRDQYLANALERVDDDSLGPSSESGCAAQ